MDTAEELVRNYLRGNAKTMQLATVEAGLPWIATVYFVADDELNVYWLSWPDRRHSVQLHDDANVAAAIVVKAGQPVIGVQLAGQAAEVTDHSEVASVMARYVKKYGQGESFYDSFVAGKNKHHMYKLTPTEISLFDEQNMPNESPVRIAK